MVYFRGFIARFGCFLGLSVRIRAQNEQKTKKNEGKRRKMTRNLRCFADFRRFLTKILIGYNKNHEAQLYADVHFSWQAS
jgi:hypothetical protein